MQNFSLRNLNTLCWRVRGWKAQGEWIRKTSGLRLAYFRAWSCSENEQRLWTTASLAKAAGWVGRVSAQSGVSGTKDRVLWLPRSSPSTSILPKLPKCRSARVRANTHTHTLGLARAQSTLRRPRQAALPPRWARRPGCSRGRGRSQGENNASDP